MRVTTWCPLMLAAGLVALDPGAAHAQARSIQRQQLPRPLREQLDRGRLIKLSSGAAAAVAATTSAIVIRPGEWIAGKTGESPVFRRTEVAPPDTGASRGPASERVDSVFAIPFTYIGFDKNGNTPTYEPIFIPQGGLRYLEARGLFEGSFLIGLQLADAPGEERQLARSIGMTFGGDADSIAPTTLQFARAGGPEERVTVVARSVRDSLRVQIIPRFDPKGATVWLAVRPALTFETPPKSMQGYGVELHPLRIGIRGIDLHDSITVSVSSDHGSITPDEIRVGPSGGSVRLRSDGHAVATVQAVASGFQPAETMVDFALPWRFAVASLSGGTLGALYAELRRRRRRAGSAAVWRRIAGAILGAVLATVIYVGLNVNLLMTAVGVPLANDLAVFAFSALGAMFGLKALSAAGGKADGH